MNRFGSRIVWCLLLFFGCISLISWHYLHNGRERVNIQMPTDNPLKAKLGRPLKNGGFARKRIQSLGSVHYQSGRYLPHVCFLLDQ